MFKSLLGIFYKDFKWKLFSLGLAALLWFIAMNYINPTRQEAFYRYLTLSNKEVLARDNVVILNARELETKPITVNVRATQNDLNLLDTKSSNIVASIDLRSVDTSLVLKSDRPVRVDVDVDVDILPGYERMNRWPVSVSVELDKLVRETRNITVNPSGEVAEGYELQGVSGAYDIVTVSGAKSNVDKVKSVRAKMNVQGAEGDFDRMEKLYAYDADDNDITATVDLSVSEIRVYATIYPYKPVKLELRMTGMPASDYKVTDVVIDPETVNIAAPAETLEQITALTLDGVNLDNVNETVVKAIDIRQALTGLNAALKRDEPAEAVVTVGIERQVVREFTFPVADIRILGYPAGATVQLIGEEDAVISVRGGESVMEGLTADRISVQLNLAGRRQGEHTVPLTVTLPRGITLAVEPPELEVIIGGADETAPPVDTETDTDTPQGGG